MAQNILLDPSIRDWVLIPLFAIVVFMGILRHFTTLLFNTTAKPVMTNICNMNIANYGRMLCNAGSSLPPEAHKKRAERMLNTQLKKEVEAPNPMEMMNDPNMMMGLMKNQFMMMVPNIGMMMLTSYFFSGFVVAKFPFPLSHRFQGMMQRGLDIDNLDCNYVTSLSLYFMIMSGCQGLLQLLLGQDVDSMNDQALMMQQMQGGAPGQPVDFKKIFKQITSDLEFVKDRHKWEYADAPTTLIKEWKAGKMRAARLKARK